MMTKNVASSSNLALSLFPLNFAPKQWNQGLNWNFSGFWFCYWEVRQTQTVQDNEMLSGESERPCVDLKLNWATQLLNGAHESIYSAYHSRSSVLLTYSSYSYLILTVFMKNILAMKAPENCITSHYMKYPYFEDKGQ